MSERMPSGEGSQPGQSELSGLVIPEELHFAQDFVEFLGEDENLEALEGKARLSALGHQAHIFVRQAVDNFPPSLARPWHRQVPDKKTAAQIDIIARTLATHRDPHRQPPMIIREQYQNRLYRLRDFAGQKLIYDRFPETYGALELGRQCKEAGAPELAETAGVLLAAYGVVIQSLPIAQRKLPNEYYDEIYRNKWGNGRGV